MAPEQEARTRALYDHESDEPRRRRRAAADWGVNEDIFDRMPSRFARAERRGRSQHQEIVLRRDEAEAGPVVIEHGDAAGDVALSAAGGGARVRGADAARVRGTVTARSERASHGGELDPRAAARAVMSWGEDLDDDVAPMVPGESRTIVLTRDADTQHDDLTETGAADDFAREARVAGEPEVAGAEQHERRTVKISGYPDRLPAQRPPRTAVERIGHKPDRIVAYAVALGFLLVLIAVLTTGQ